MAAGDALIRLVGANEPVQSIEEAFAFSKPSQDCIELGRLFSLHGSDKSSKHDYHLAYSSLSDINSS